MAGEKRVRVSFYRGSHGFRDYTVSVSTLDGKEGVVGGGRIRKAAKLYLRSCGFEIGEIDKILEKAYREGYVFDEILTPNLSEREIEEAGRALWRYWNVRVNWHEYRRVVLEYGQGSVEAKEAKRWLKHAMTLDRPY